MKPFCRYLMIGTVVLMTVSGCATRRQMQELSVEVSSIRADLQAIRADNARLDSLFKSNIEQSRKLNADFAAYVSRLDDRMQMVEARLQDAVTLINRASGAIESRGGGRSSRGPAADSAAADTAAESGGFDCQKVFNSAYFDFVKEDFDLARQGFDNYIKQCSNTALADNAQYWIGECYYLQKDYARAQQEYEKLMNNYPSSEKFAAAKLKFAKSLYNQRYKTKAETYFREIIKDYPGTDEAQDAADMLERYK
jgi:tol-pal system protein YbgF